jgi:hypothetical protein
MDGSIQHGAGASWKAVDSGFRIAPGDSLRTDLNGVAALAFPWMSILIGSETVVGLLPSAVLSVSLERGRIEEQAVAGDILKVVTAEAEVRGRGTVIVSRSDAGSATQVSALSGWFRVRGRRGTVSLETGQGALVSAAGVAETIDLPPPPSRLSPGADALYVPRGTSAHLSWAGTAPRYHVTVLDLAGDEVVLSREADAPAIEVPARALGTYRWRVSSIDARGVEGLPSATGLFCVVEK